MIVRELAKDEALKQEDWSRFLPQFKKKNVPRKKPKKVSAKKPYTPFPEPQQPSKIDLQLETGEYFASEHQRKQKQLQDKRAASRTKSEEKRATREQASETAPSRKQKTTSLELAKGNQSDQEVMEERVKRKFKTLAAREESSYKNLSDFVEQSTQKATKRSKKSSK
jgi:ribosomal RNA assembly protein